MLNTIKPYFSFSVALLVATILVIVDFYFNDIAIFWIAVLWILLFSTILVMLGQLIHAEKEIQNYATQLTSNKERLTNEIKHRLWAEKTTAETKAKSQIIDENIPVLLAYFNTEQRCRYHNRIFRRWFGLKPDQIDGSLLQEFANKEFSSSIQNHIEDILAGKTIHKERVMKSAKGFPYIFTEQYVPHQDNKGKIIGFYTLHTPCAQDNKRFTSRNDQKAKPALEIASMSTTKKSTNDHSQTGITADRIAQAIKGGEFNLYCQRILALDPNSLLPDHYEILIRMAEEENNLMPPGSFLPLVDQFGMMPELDRWVVSHIIKCLTTFLNGSRSVFCLNVAKDTLCDKTFISFVQDRLQKSKIPAHLLCFEIEELDAESHLIETVFFSTKIRELGCLVTLCSFGQNTASMNLLKKLRIDYLKIDGGIICNMLNNDEDHMRVEGINQIARKLNIKTIAELVENDETAVKLREIGINFAQGFGIARPCPLDNLDTLSKKADNPE
ncbi:sensor domain-containing phosphodiesterase [Nitrosomonas aestuarii]|uniref:sensor domain-containing phosphodiesterase n=1 Tax=Nitrosomonas aestuarii TaxID=52441 RepID=UPI000D2F72E9|nr:EAL domain-containing protein [Nitrosomonas aestuarii]PTN08896.1 EAL domain-containing protein (putative c-di-GMP-specific phosphodiesterase class I) [Nitrosomonas aestuarii]